MLLLHLLGVVHLSYQDCGILNEGYQIIQEWWMGDEQAIRYKRPVFCLQSLPNAQFADTCNLAWACLTIEYHNITDLGATLKAAGCENVDGLKLNNNAIKSIQASALKYQYLKEVNIQYNDITTLSNDLFSATVKKVDLSFNNISLIDSLVFSDTGIECLNLRHNRIRRINFKFPASLVHLELSFNLIEHIETSSFYETTQLKTLHLNNNVLKTLPTALFGQMGKLSVINLQHNSIASLPSALFSPHDSLRIHADFSFNNISTIEKDAFSSQGIEYLNLMNNALESVNFTLPTSLKFLDISFNKVRYIKGSIFSELVSIKILNANDNSLEEISTVIPKSTINVDEISLQHNNISSIPNQLFASNSTIQNLNLSGNFIATIQPDAYLSCTVNKLDLSGNRLQKLDFNFPESLTLLDLSFNRIAQIDPEAFQAADRLETLLLNKNHLTSLPKGCFRTLTNLKSMSLSSNELTVSHGVFTGLKGLEQLDLANNSIGNFSELLLHDLTNLNVLDVENNRLRSLNVKDLMLNLKSLRRIKVKGNKFDCDYLVKLMAEFRGAGVEVEEGDEFVRSNVKGITCEDKVVTEDQPRELNNAVKNVSGELKTLEALRGIGLWKILTS